MQTGLAKVNKPNFYLSFIISCSPHQYNVYKNKSALNCKQHIYKSVVCPFIILS